MQSVSSATIQLRATAPQDLRIHLELGFFAPSIKTVSDALAISGRFATDFPEDLHLVSATSVGVEMLQGSEWIRSTGCGNVLVSGPIETLPELSSRAYKTMRDREFRLSIAECVLADAEAPVLLLKLYAEYAMKALTGPRQRVLLAISDLEKPSNQVIAQHVMASQNSTGSRISWLRRRGYIRTVRQGRGSFNTIADPALEAGLWIAGCRYRGGDYENWRRSFKKGLEERMPAVRMWAERVIASSASFL